MASMPYQHRKYPSAFYDILRNDEFRADTARAWLIINMMSWHLLQHCASALQWHASHLLIFAQGSQEFAVAISALVSMTTAAISRDGVNKHVWQRFWCTTINCRSCATKSRISDASGIMWSCLSAVKRIHVGEAKGAITPLAQTIKCYGFFTAGSTLLAMLEPLYYLRPCPSRRLSVFPSHSGVLSRRMKLRSCGFHSQVAQSF